MGCGEATPCHARARVNFFNGTHYGQVVQFTLAVCERYTKQILTAGTVSATKKVNPSARYVMAWQGYVIWHAFVCRASLVHMLVKWGVHSGRVGGCARAARLLVGVTGVGGWGGWKEEERGRGEEERGRGEEEEERFRPRSPPQANFEAVL